VLEYLARATVLAGWTSLIWAPLIVGVIVRRPRYKWPAVAGAAATMLALFVGIYALSQPAADCESLEEFQKILCAEGYAAQGFVMGITMLTMTLAVLLASAILFICRDTSEHETRKVAH